MSDVFGVNEAISQANALTQGVLQRNQDVNRFHKQVADGLKKTQADLKSQLDKYMELHGAEGLYSVAKAGKGVYALQNDIRSQGLDKYVAGQKAIARQRFNLMLGRETESIPDEPAAPKSSTTVTIQGDQPQSQPTAETTRTTTRTVTQTGGEREQPTTVDEEPPRSVPDAVAPPSQRVSISRQDFLRRSQSAVKEEPFTAPATTAPTTAATPELKEDAEFGIEDVPTFEEEARGITGTAPGLISRIGNLGAPLGPQDRLRVSRGAAPVNDEAPSEVRDLEAEYQNRLRTTPFRSIPGQEEPTLARAPILDDAEVNEGRAFMSQLGRTATEGAAATGTQFANMAFRGTRGLASSANAGFSQILDSPILSQANLAARTEQLTGARLRLAELEGVDYPRYGGAPARQVIKSVGRSVAGGVRATPPAAPQATPQQSAEASEAQLQATSEQAQAPSTAAPVAARQSTADLEEELGVSSEPAAAAATPAATPAARTPSATSRTPSTTTTTTTTEETISSRPQAVGGGQTININTEGSSDIDQLNQKLSKGLQKGGEALDKLGRIAGVVGAAQDIYEDFAPSGHGDGKTAFEDMDKAQKFSNITGTIAGGLGVAGMFIPGLDAVAGLIGAAGAVVGGVDSLEKEKAKAGDAARQAAQEASTEKVEAAPRLAQAGAIASVQQQAEPRTAGISAF